MVIILLFLCSRTMPYSLANDEETRHVFCDLSLRRPIYICIESGLPDRFHLCRFYQLFLGLWDACHRYDRASAKDRALFERFLRGKVIPLGKADWILEIEDDQDWRLHES
jgi:hypothetical protein